MVFRIVEVGIEVLPLRVIGRVEVDQRIFSCRWYDLRDELRGVEVGQHDLLATSTNTLNLARQV